MTAPAACTGQAETRASHLTTTQCADLVLLGARGQDQTLDDVGGEVKTTTKALVDELPDGRTVRLEGVDYDASTTRSDATYAQNVEAGARELARRQAELARACPASRFGLIGFSVGAEVVHRAVVDPVDVDSIAVVAMIGDPVRNPDDRIRHVAYGTSEPQGSGSVARGAPVAEGLRHRTASFCVADDEVCGAAERGRTIVQSPLHKGFYEEPAHARETARVMVNILERTLP